MNGMRGKLLATTIFILTGLGLFPLTEQLRRERVVLEYGQAGISRAVRDQVGQGMAIALLAGFRGIVADFIWIDSHRHWEKKEWLQQYQQMQLATLLQPHSVLFWDIGAWHMAWNIGYAVSVDTNNVSRAMGLKRRQIWWDRAKTFLERGIENNPNKYNLYFALAWLEDQKYQAPCRAARSLEKASQFPEAPSYVARMYARAVEECGDPQRAYQIWRDLWFSDRTQVHQLWEVVEREIKRLEERLQIPEDQRVFPPSGATVSDNVT